MGGSSSCATARPCCAICSTPPSVAIRNWIGPAPAFLLYVDQGEELYVRAEERQRHRFSEVIAQGVADLRLYILMSMRADFLGELQKDEPLFKVHRKIDVPPLREAELREVVSRPAELLSARFETAGLADIITRRTAEDSVKDVGALPLLSYTLDDMWTQMVKRDDGVLRLAAQSFELGGVLVNRADAFLAAHPECQDELRRIFTLKLATVREGEEPTRRPAARSEFTDEEWRLVSELVDHPNRLLVTATPEGGETYAEVAHEAIFRRWDKLRDWIAAEREFLAWRTGLEAARRAWQTTPDRSKNEALLMGFGLKQAETWARKRADDIPESDRDFIMRSRKIVQRRRVRVQMLIVALLAGVAAWWQSPWLKERAYWLVHTHPLPTARERMLEAGADFTECTHCPKMVVVPPGNFMMGSLEHSLFFTMELPRHPVTIKQRFAVSAFELTYDQWDACVAYGDCSPDVADEWGRGAQPVNNVSWKDAQTYVAWLKRITGKDYRLLTEAEWEYAARAQHSAAQTHFSFGNDDAELDQYAWYEANSERQPHPVGLKKPNVFGLFDMHGNVAEWVQDCYHDSYDAAPSDGSAWPAWNCVRNVIRGGSYLDRPRMLRSSAREWSDKPTYSIGVRVARSLAQ